MSDAQDQPMITKGIEDMLAAYPDERETLLRTIVHAVSVQLVQEQGERGLNFIRRLPDILSP